MPANGDKCPVCDEVPIKVAGRDKRGTTGQVNESLLPQIIDCPRCGKYAFPERGRLSESAIRVRHLISAWIRRSTDNEELVWITSVDLESDTWARRFNYQGYPSSVPERLDALLTLLGERMPAAGGYMVDWSPPMVAAIAAKNAGELSALSGLLEESGWIQRKPTGQHYITVRGYERIAELKRSNPQFSDKAFVAMWFDDSTRAYRDAVAAAIMRAGYWPVIVDQPEFNDFIMDRIRAGIREARFVIADFTCMPEATRDGKLIGGSRGGVYWEAGFAYGLGRLVIHTRKDDDASKDRAHFDIAQYSTIFWKDDELGTEIRESVPAGERPSLAERLVQRIRANVRQGPRNPVEPTTAT